jgi:HEAT repeat protein
MFSIKRFLILAAVVVFAVSTAAAQSQSNNETSIEESYLQDALENMIIRESSRTDSRASKLVALKFIGEAIDHGNTSEDVHQSLEYLALEGTRSQARENGRLVNNYPDVRLQAAIYLGKLGTEEAKGTLLEICSKEKDPTVLFETINSLGNIGTNDNNKTVDTIIWTVDGFNNTNKPDPRLALATIFAFEKIAKKNNGLSPEAIRLIIRISENGSYEGVVRERARQFLTDMRSYNSSRKN